MAEVDPNEKSVRPKTEKLRVRFLADSRVCGACLQFFALSLGDGFIFPQSVSQMSDATYVLAMIAYTGGALIYLILD